MSTDEEQINRMHRRKRIARLKKVILGTIAACILIPIGICVLLGIRLYKTDRKLGLLQEKFMELQVELEQTKQLYEQEMTTQAARLTALPGQEIQQEEATEAPEKFVPETEIVPKEDEKRRIYLTFDDGPSAETDVILDILQEYDVKATFFVIGKDDEVSQAAYRRIVEDGHTLGMHSYTHKYAEIYASADAFVADLEKLQNYLYEITGERSIFYRFPGGSSNHVSRTPMTDLIGCLQERGILYFDWNVSSGDATGTMLSSQAIVNNVMWGLGENQDCIILFHDSTAKKSTVEALPEILEKLTAMEDTEILPISSDTKLIQHLTISQMNP